MSNKETMFNNELKEGVKRNMLNRINNNDMVKVDNKELKDNDDILKDNNSRIIINNYKPNYNTTNSNNDYKYGDYNYNNSLDLDNCKIPFNGMDNNSNYSLFNNKKQISEEDIKNSKVYKELLEENIKLKNKYINMKEMIEKGILIIKQITKNRCSDKDYSDIISILDILFPFKKDDNNSRLIEKDKGGE